MTDVITHNQIMAEIKASLNHILHSLNELSARINPTFSQTQPAQPLRTPTHLSSPPPLAPSNPTRSSIPKLVTSTQYPVKYLTYSEMQQRRDHDLCLNCDEKYTPAHRCQNKRILIILPNDDSDLKPQPPHFHENMKQTTLFIEKDLENNEVSQSSYFPQPNDSMMGNGTFRSSVFIHDKADGANRHSHDVRYPCDVIVVGNVAQNGFTTKAVDIFLLDGVKPAVHMIDFVVAMKRNGCPELLMDLVSCTKAPCESKVFIFDPGGKIVRKSIFQMKSIYGDAHLIGSHLTTLRTRSISERMVMIGNYTAELAPTRPRCSIKLLLNISTEMHKITPWYKAIVVITNSVLIAFFFCYKVVAAIDCNHMKLLDCHVAKIHRM